MTSVHSGSPAGGAVRRVLTHALAQNWWMFVARGAAAILFGVLAFIWPGATLLAIAVVWGVYALVDGALALWGAINGVGPAGPRWWLAVAGLAGIVAGVLAIAWPGVTALVLLYVIAAWAILIGVVQILGAIRLRKEIEGEWLLILFGALNVLFGVFLFSQPAAGAVATVWVIGTFAIGLGVLLLLFGLRLNKFRKSGR